MTLTKLKFKGGIDREVTQYSAENGWYDGDKIRFRFGNVEKIGGWVKRTLDGEFLNKARKMIGWADLSTEKLLVIGTSKKLYLVKSTLIFDITPQRASSTINNNPFNITTDSSTIEVTDTSHGAVTGDFVTFSGATTLGGNITANVLNQEYQITAVKDANTYFIEARTAGTSIISITSGGVLSPTLVNAVSGDSANGGGSSVTAAYQINGALDVSVTDIGWSAENWNAGGFGDPADITGAASTLRDWSMDTFGEDLIINAKNGGIFYWDTSENKGPIPSATTRAADRAVNITGYNSNSDGTTPQVATCILVSDVDRHVIAFGTGLEGSPAVQDPLLIRFSDQENPIVWQSTASNTAGDLRVGVGNKIITAIQTKQEILVFTDLSLHSMQFQGPPFTFGIQLISQNITITGATSVVNIDDTVFWMGDREFYTYQGGVQKIPCTVRDYVFNDFNLEQKEQVVGGSNASFGEVWWFYPSSGSNTNNRYVIYNYAEQIWYYGNLSRDFWLGQSVFNVPLAVSNGAIFEHENGYDDTSTSPPSALNSFIESADLDVQDGYNFFFMKRLIPDVSFRNSINDSGTVSFVIKAKSNPGNNYSDTTTGSSTTTASVTKDPNAVYQYGVDSFTESVDVRVRGRSFVLRVENNEVGVAWRLGSPRVDIKPDGRR